jgi:recombinational DNA repair protein (RecF pathway)
MIEHYTKGIVLDRKIRGEIDGTVVLYTEGLGKISAFVKSIRRPTSKLSGHLMPGKMVKVRMVEKNNIQAVDVLSEKNLCDPRPLLSFIKFLDEVIPYGEPDSSLWHGIENIVENRDFSPRTYNNLLRILGFGGESVACGYCTSREIEYFSIADIMFLCNNCLKKVVLNRDGLIKIK